MSLSRLLTFALVSTLAFACADSISRPPSPTPVPPSKPKRKSMSFAMETDSPLYEAALDAAEELSAALGIPVTVSPEGEIPIYQVEACPPPPDPSVIPTGARVGACSLAIGSPDARIEVPTYLSESYWRVGLMHEMGHHLRGHELNGVQPHLSDPNSVMFGGKVSPDAQLTPEDVRFLCEALDCPDPPPGAA